MANDRVAEHEKFFNVSMHIVSHIAFAGPVQCYANATVSFVDRS